VDRIRVLHVDDDATWRDLVKIRLEEAGFEVVSFPDIKWAKNYVARDIAVFVCDGSVRYKGDGRKWAKALNNDGHKAVVLSGSKPDFEIPFLVKTEFGNGEKLVAILRSLIGQMAEAK
jgi:DNA-binding NtrC family response regulator